MTNPGGLSVTFRETGDLSESLSGRQVTNPGGLSESLSGRQVICQSRFQGDR